MAETSIEDRFASLEKSNRQQRRWFFALGALLVASWSVGAKWSGEGELRGRSLTLIGDDGRVLATFGPTSDGVALTLHDRKELPRLEIGVNAHGPQVALRNNNGVPRAELSQSAGDVGLYIRDSANKIRVAIAAPGDRNRTPGIAVISENGELVGEMK